MTKRYKGSVWYQVGGDVNPATYGGTIARDDGGYVDVLHIQPVREYVSTDEAAEIGCPYWAKEASYSLADLQAFIADRFFRSCWDLDNAGEYFDLDNKRWPRARRLYVAGLACEAGYLSDEGPAGYSFDIIPRRVSWWGKGTGIADFRAEDTEFRAMMKAR